VGTGDRGRKIEYVHTGQGPGLSVSHEFTGL